LFEPIGVSTKRADVSYQVVGTDISNYYYNVTSGGTAFGTTNLQSGGVDIGTMFAAAGSVSYGPTVGFLYTWGFGTTGQTAQIDTTSWTLVSSRYHHTAAIRSDGILFTWGQATNGELGDGTTVNKSSPVQIGSSSWIAISAGNGFTGAF
jgi:hypothetical protein